MPRPYKLGKREAQKADTRARIVAAMVSLYRDGGAKAATIKAVAAQADVAVATVQNHFPGRGDLADAAADVVMAELRLPDPAIFEGQTTIRARIARLAHELAAFFVRSEAWWRIYDRDAALASAWAGAVERFYADLDRLFRAALGPLGSDETAVAVLSAVVGPPLFFDLRGRGLTADEAAGIATSMIVPWLEGRSGQGG
jgi:AcrR family transcriptional regulator